MVFHDVFNYLKSAPPSPPTQSRICLLAVEREQEEPSFSPNEIFPGFDGVPVVLPLL